MCYHLWRVGSCHSHVAHTAGYHDLVVCDNCHVLHCRLRFFKVKVVFTPQAGAQSSMDQRREIKRLGHADTSFTDALA